jgi:hypothetical protein
MSLFRIYLVGVFVGLIGYTIVVGMNHGWNLVPIFFGDIALMNWPGQFNLDFMTYLGLSAIWVAWRHQFTSVGIALGVVAFVGGMIFLAPYLLWASMKAGGDARTLLLGSQRASSL